jgi:hypothetical protein
MVSDAQRLRRVIQQIRRLGNKYTAEAMAASLRKDGIKSDYVRGAEDLICDIREYMRIAERKEADANPKEDRLCPQCHRALEWDNQKYCSRKCKQRAYRKRVTAKPRSGSSASVTNSVSLRPALQQVGDEA